MGCGGSKDAVVSTNKDIIEDGDNNNTTKTNGTVAAKGDKFYFVSDSKIYNLTLE